jgi:hypothetical protein
MEAALAISGNGLFARNARVAGVDPERALTLGKLDNRVCWEPTAS